MNEQDDPTLLAAAEAVMDGMTVDWAGLKAGNPALAKELSVMERMAEVAKAHRTLLEEGDVT